MTNPPTATVARKEEVPIEEGEPPLVPSIESTIDALKDAIWSRRPILGQIMREHGNKTLYEYSSEFWM